VKAPTGEASAGENHLRWIARRWKVRRLKPLEQTLQLGKWLNCRG